MAEIHNSVKLRDFSTAANPNPQILGGVVLNCWVVIVCKLDWGEACGINMG
jgi:hypothetical protein